MKILVTGANGFIGKNLVERLKYRNLDEIFDYDKNDSIEKLEKYCGECDFVYHLAGVNRPEHSEDYHTGNYGFTSQLLALLKKSNNKCPVMLSSSIQADLDNPYGKSKLEGEQLLRKYGKDEKVNIFIYRFPNIFGKWCQPNYNSVVATFCHNITHDLPIQIHNKDARLKFVYIDDVVDELLSLLNTPKEKDSVFQTIQPVYEITVGEIADLLYSFKKCRNTLAVPDMTEGSFSKKLYSTYLSYLPETGFSYPLKMNVDHRGSFTEIFRTSDRGQFSVNISKPGVEKGNHWHCTKNEKFVVVSGKALIQFRRTDSSQVIEYHVSGEQLEVVDIPAGYTHNIINEGDSDLITFMWCNECYNPERPDTYCLSVASQKEGN